MAESNFTTPEQKMLQTARAARRPKLEPSLNTLQGETAQMQAEPTIPVREEASAAPKGLVRCFELLERPKAFLWAIWPYSAVLP